jgi:hypothetical protein
VTAFGVKEHANITQYHTSDHEPANAAFSIRLNLQARHESLEQKNQMQQEGCGV